jgi:hypothetical protein
MEEQKELLRKLGTQVPATAGTQTGVSRRALRALDAVTSSIRMVFGVRSGLCQPQRLTVLAIAREARFGNSRPYQSARDARAVVLSQRRLGPRKTETQTRKSIISNGPCLPRSPSVPAPAVSDVSCRCTADRCR